MAKRTLLPCTNCDRHVRHAERACPFCGAALTLVAPAARPLRAGATRSALMGAVIAGGVGLVGCNAGPLYGAPPEDGGMAAADAQPSGADGAVGTLYGAPPDDAAVGDDASMMDDDAGAPAAEYGAPPMD